MLKNSPIQHISWPVRLLLCAVSLINLIFVPHSHAKDSQSVNQYYSDLTQDRNRMLETLLP
jgi:hypothetical protein